MVDNNTMMAVLMVLEDTDDEQDTEDPIVPLLAVLATTLEGHEVPKVAEYSETVVPLYDNQRFRRMFRMSRNTFELICTYMKDLPEMTTDGAGGREPISIEKQLQVTMWYFGTLDTIDRIADRFGVSLSSVIRIRDKVTGAIVRHMKTKFIVWPQDREIGEVVDQFSQRNGFPGIVGSLDGTHIQIRRPSDHGQSYVNRKGYHSLQLQAVCKLDMSFTHAFTGYPGSCHDSRILKNSDLWQNGLQMCRPGNHIIADGGYPLRKWLLTPFRNNGHLTREQRRYNYYLSSNRVVIERAFALLKGRLRRLLYLDTLNIETADQVARDNMVNIALIQDHEAEGVLRRNQIARDLL
ncbi:hypothetical protein ScPMuIL_007556 [Solemya velum]